MHHSLFLKRRFRTGSSFRLKEWNQLNKDDRYVLQELSGSEDVYGLFLPNHAAPHLTAKLAYTETTLLYFHFQQNPFLPHCFANRSKEEVEKIVAHLVLDGVLEVEWNGTYVCGSRALEAIYGFQHPGEPGVPSFLSTLSMQAISYAFLLRHRNVSALSQWLYTSNTLPWDAAAKMNYASERQVYEFLFSQTGNDTKEQLQQSWQAIPPQNRSSWFSWIKQGIQHSSKSPDYKLYVSPTPKHLPEVIQRLIPVLTKSKAFCFKTGITAQGLLRPDKLVAYFSGYEALFETAYALENELADYAVQGVPFTCQLDKRGMLSWGIDPPSQEVLQAVESGSWRTKVTEQLALAILQAKEDVQTFKTAIPFLRAKLHTAGIDMSNWSATEDQN